MFLTSISNFVQIRCFYYQNLKLKHLINNIARIFIFLKFQNSGLIKIYVSSLKRFPYHMGDHGLIICQPKVTTSGNMKTESNYSNII